MSLSRIDAAWLAGLYEGEGTLGPLSKGGWRMCISMTDFDVIERVHVVTGEVGRVSQVKQAENRLPQLRWTVCRREHIQEIVVAIRPLLGARRGARVDEFLAWLAAPDRRTTKGETICRRCGDTRVPKRGSELRCPTCRRRWEAAARERKRAAAKRVAASALSG